MNDPDIIQCPKCKVFRRVTVAPNCVICNEKTKKPKLPPRAPYKVTCSCGHRDYLYKGSCKECGIKMK